jgi:hypothetical protein
MRIGGSRYDHMLPTQTLPLRLERDYAWKKIRLQRDSRFYHLVDLPWTDIDSVAFCHGFPEEFARSLR